MLAIDGSSMSSQTAPSGSANMTMRYWMLTSTCVRAAGGDDARQDRVEIIDAEVGRHRRARAHRAEGGSRVERRYDGQRGTLRFADREEGEAEAEVADQRGVPIARLKHP